MRFKKNYLSVCLDESRILLSVSVYVFLGRSYQNGMSQTHNHLTSSFSIARKLNTQITEFRFEYPSTIFSFYRLCAVFEYSACSLNPARPLNDRLNQTDGAYAHITNICKKKSNLSSDFPIFFSVFWILVCVNHILLAHKHLQQIVYNVLLFADRLSSLLFDFSSCSMFK